MHGLNIAAIIHAADNMPQRSFHLHRFTVTADRPQAVLFIDHDLPPARQGGSKTQHCQHSQLRVTARDVMMAVPLQLAPTVHGAILYQCDAICMAEYIRFFV